MATVKAFSVCKSSGGSGASGVGVSESVCLCVRVDVSESMCYNCDVKLPSCGAAVFTR